MWQVTHFPALPQHYAPPPPTVPKGPLRLPYHAHTHTHKKSDAACNLCQVLVTFAVRII